MRGELADAGNIGFVTAVWIVQRMRADFRWELNYNLIGGSRLSDKPRPRAANRTGDAPRDRK